MSAALPLTVKHMIAVGHMSKGRVVKDIEQTWCRAIKSARGDGKFAAAMRRLPSSMPVLGISLQPLYFTLLYLRHYSSLARGHAAAAATVAVAAKCERLL